ncbi:hypothetical protein WDW89_15850, partial [Deltaproteobacteria bacterium TL4]
TLAQVSLSRDSAMISTNRRMRSRMYGGVGGGGEKPLPTRFDSFCFITTISEQCFYFRLSLRKY